MRIVRSHRPIIVCGVLQLRKVKEINRQSFRLLPLVKRVRVKRCFHIVVEDSTF